MDVVHPRCCGLDVHKQTVVACVLISSSSGQPQKTLRTVGTLTDELLALADWLASQGVTHVALEATGAGLLEARMEPAGGSLRAAAGQCPAHQDGARSQ